MQGNFKYLTFRIERNSLFYIVDIIETLIFANSIFSTMQNLKMKDKYSNLYVTDSLIFDSLIFAISIFCTMQNIERVQILYNFSCMEQKRETSYSPIQFTCRF